MNQADYSPQIVVTNRYVGQNSRNFLLPGKDKNDHTCLRGYATINSPSLALKLKSYGVVLFCSTHPIFPIWFWTVKGSEADG